MATSYTDRPRKPQTGAGRPGLPTSPQGVGKGPKIVDLSKLDFPYEPTAVLCREFKGGFRPIYRIEQRPSDPRVGPTRRRRPRLHTQRRRRGRPGVLGENTLILSKTVVGHFPERRKHFGRESVAEAESAAPSEN